MLTYIRRALSFWHLRRAADLAEVEMIFTNRATAIALSHEKIVANEF